MRAKHVAAASLYIFFSLGDRECTRTNARTKESMYRRKKKENADPSAWFPLLRAYNARQRVVFPLRVRLSRLPAARTRCIERVSTKEKDVGWILKTCRRRKLLLLPTPRLSLMCSRATSSSPCSLPVLPSRFLASQGIRNHHHQLTLTTPL